MSNLTKFVHEKDGDMIEHKRKLKQKYAQKEKELRDYEGFYKENTIVRNPKLWTAKSLDKKYGLQEKIAEVKADVVTRFDAVDEGLERRR